MFPIPNDIPCLPGSVRRPEPPRRALWRQMSIFLAVFLVLQLGYGALRGSWVEHLLIDTLTVAPAAALIHIMSPELPVWAEGSRLKAPGGGINVLNGCEGTEVLFLLYAAFAAAVMPWRARLAGLAAGTLLVYALNQARVIALFHAYRSDRAWFDLLHGTVAPLALIAITTLFFLYWLERHDQCGTSTPAA